jgi:hypothetical protein
MLQRKYSIHKVIILHISRARFSDSCNVPSCNVQCALLLHGKEYCVKKKFENCWHRSWLIRWFSHDHAYAGDCCVNRNLSDKPVMGSQFYRNVNAHLHICSLFVMRLAVVCYECGFATHECHLNFYNISFFNIFMLDCSVQCSFNLLCDVHLFS